MKLVKVTGKNFNTKCCHCGKHVTAGDNQDVHADIEGIPYQSYYCNVCTNFSKVVDIKSL
jgi:hypothetical protein